MQAACSMAVQPDEHLTCFLVGGLPALPEAATVLCDAGVDALTLGDLPTGDSDPAFMLVAMLADLAAAVTFDMAVTSWCDWLDRSMLRCDDALCESADQASQSEA